MGFWEGFVKRAAEQPVAGPKQADAPVAQPIEKLLKWNSEGGVDPRTPEDMQVAQAVDLITLPKNVEGANCAGCMHARMLDEGLGHIFCTNPQVKQDVTPQMVCSLWDHPEIYRSWENVDPAEAEVTQAQGAQQQAVEQEDDMAAEQALQSGQAAVAPPAQQSKEKPKEKKKSEPASKPAHTINVNVGGAEKKAFWKPFGEI
jgi:hypothetical protein